MNLFDLMAKITLDTSGYDKGVGEATSKGEKLAGTLKSGITKGLKVATKAVAATGTAITGLAGIAVKTFADFEQLTGGVETLFKDSAGTVMQYAQEAYKSAGMSANAYMETITGFSASLLQSLGNDTAKAAEYGNMAVVDMSDNANKMGTSIESIQNAYQGFAKQNYTMLSCLAA